MKKRQSKSLKTKRPKQSKRRTTRTRRRIQRRKTRRRQSGGWTKIISSGPRKKIKGTSWFFGKNKKITGQTDPVNFSPEQCARHPHLCSKLTA
jgi:hypothetical protein